MAVLSTNIQLDMTKEVFGATGGTETNVLKVVSYTNNQIVFFTGTKYELTVSGKGFKGSFARISGLEYESSDGGYVHVTSLSDSLTRLNAGTAFTPSSVLDGNDNLTGSRHNDFLIGFKGNDTIDGGDGADTVRYNGDRSRYDVSRDGDVVTITDKLSGSSGGEGTDQVSNVEFFQFADVRFTTDDLAPPPTVVVSLLAPTTSGNDTILGTDAGEVIMGGAGADDIRSGSGDDWIQLGEGDDSFANGNGGNDTIHGGAGNDARMLGGADVDQVYGEAGDDFANGNKGNDIVQGGDGADTVHGGQDDDVVYGDVGDDMIYGDKGSDTLFGGVGADVFVFRAGSGHDVVSDFMSGEDKLDVTGLFGDSASAVAAFSNGVLAITSVDTVSIANITSLSESDFIFV
jgi:Ca2+-binding RTX toxin-like protein